MEARVGSKYVGAMTDPTALPDFPPPPQEHPLRGRVLDALQDLKLSPDLDGDGDVAFTAQQQRLFVRCMEGEQVDVMRVFGQWKIADAVPGDLLTRLNGCNDITLGVNLVKAGISAGNLVLTVEQVVTKQENPRGRLQIAVGMILQAVQLWHKNVLAKAAREAGTAPEGGSEVGPWLSVGRRGEQQQDAEGEEQ